jgi:hypothetical protein
MILDDSIRCKCLASSDQNASSQASTFDYDIKMFDVYNEWSTATYRFSPLKSGIYNVIANHTYHTTNSTAQDTSYRIATVVNGVTKDIKEVFKGSVLSTGLTTIYDSLQTCHDVYLSTDDYLTIQHQYFQFASNIHVNASTSALLSTGICTSLTIKKV